jgi:VRR-NUC domain
MTEAQLQQKCFMWFHNEAYKDQRGRLWHAFNNPPNRIQGAMLKGMGLVAGVADFVYLMPFGRTLFIELKTEKGTQSEEQKTWQNTVESIGFEYVVCRTFEDFKTIINEKNL